MKHRMLSITLVALSLGLSGLAPAQGQSERGVQQRDDRGHERAGRGHRADHDRHQDRRDDRRDDRETSRYRSDPYHQYADRGPNMGGRDWRRGERLPAQYRGHRYLVEDWRGHHLYAPPRGQYWVQSGGDYLLVAIATGVIVSILLSN